ncbi:MAG: deoxyhypusine synthase [Candidatus Abyssobacteria bacterium SURF_17]|uniref:Deoxyhypusine synthase n=1 Tax=Candidatus Abyssobacteria bacterium SURF_17 TaxID=2093361 RepID=A0A419EW31_9BACT|nr:MAG: deoxyhypusine synthase [Candidatus Abyssubacteria bacterium SURF_17]
MEKKDAAGFLQKPVESLQVNAESTIGDLLQRMGNTAFQARNLSTAVAIWAEMLKDNVTIFFGLAGAMVPAGMRRLITYLVKNRLIDCLVSTGANLFHDCHEEIGQMHYQGSHRADDLILKEHGIDRIYDVFALDWNFLNTDKVIADFGVSIGERKLNTREFLYLLGAHLSKLGKDAGILSAAYEAKIPIYCPAISDSSIGIALAVAAAKGSKIPSLDVISDVLESAHLVADAEATGVIYVAGGTPKNFIQQTEVTAPLVGRTVKGHTYAIQLSVDPPYWGGLSGCTFEEAQSWGKIAKQAQKVTVYCDATISLPIVVHALVQQHADLIAARKAPSLRLAWPKT